MGGWVVSFHVQESHNSPTPDLEEILVMGIRVCTQAHLLANQEMPPQLESLCDAIVREGLNHMGKKTELVGLKT